MLLHVPKQTHAPTQKETILSGARQHPSHNWASEACMNESQTVKEIEMEMEMEMEMMMKWWKRKEMRERRCLL